MKVRGDESRMYCAKLQETIRHREQWILKNGEKALILAEQVSRECYERLYR